MKKYFKTRKRIRVSFFFWIFMFLSTLYFCLSSMDDLNYSYYFNGTNNFNIKIKPKVLLNKLGFNYDFPDKVIPTLGEVVEISKPSIYLYNTHQEEKYSDTDVFEVSKVLKDLLIGRGFNVVLEDTNIKEKLNDNNYKYKDSYKVTRELLSNRLSEDFDLYIDIHRDSSKRNVSTVVIDDLSYARVMFVIGKNHKNYKYNYDLVSNLNKIIKNINNKLSRGIYVKENSAFNQDLDKNVLLIEIGGVDNTMEEVNNTLNVLCDVLEYYYYE